MLQTKDIYIIPWTRRYWDISGSDSKKNACGQWRPVLPSVSLPQRPDGFSLTHIIKKQTSRLVNRFAYDSFLCLRRNKGSFNSVPHLFCWGTHLQSACAHKEDNHAIFRNSSSNHCQGERWNIYTCCVLRVVFLLRRHEVKVNANLCAEKCCAKNAFRQKKGELRYLQSN